MKRNIVTTVLLVLLFFGLVFGVVFLNDPDLFAMKRKTEEKPQDSYDVEDLIVTYAGFGNMELTRSAQGSVISGAPEKYERKLILKDAEEDNTELKVKLLKDFDRGQVLAVCGKNELKADFDGRLISSQFDKKSKTLTLTALDYSALTVEVRLEATAAVGIDYDTPVKLEYDGNEAEAWIEYIGYEVEAGFIPITLKCEGRLTPGTQVRAVFVTESHKEGIYLPAFFVFFDFDGSAYTTAEDEEAHRLIRVPLKLGEYFERLEEGMEEPLGFYEIVSGVAAGQKITILQYGEVPKDIARLIADE